MHAYNNMVAKTMERFEIKWNKMAQVKLSILELFEWVMIMLSAK